MRLAEGPVAAVVGREVVMGVRMKSQALLEAPFELVEAHVATCRSHLARCCNAAATRECAPSAAGALQ